MKNTWFESQFLPSLFQYAGAGKLTWISAKQCDILRKYCTERKQSSFDDGQSLRHTTSLCYHWQGREVALFVERSGAGRVFFGANQQEHEAMVQHELERELEFFRKHMESMKLRHPGQYEKEKAELLSSVESLLRWKQEEPQEWDDSDQAEYEKKLRKVEILKSFS